MKARKNLIKIISVDNHISGLVISKATSLSCPIKIHKNNSHSQLGRINV